MRKSNYIRHLTLYSIIGMFFVGSFLFLLPIDISHAAEPTFAFDVTSPSDSPANLKDQNVVFSGTFTADPTNTDPITIKAYEGTTELTTKDNLKIDYTNHTWAFSNQFTNGSHEVTFTADDNVVTTNAQISIKRTIFIDTTRPQVKETKLVGPKDINGQQDETAIEDMTHVPVDAAIKVTIAENDTLDILKDANGKYLNPISVTTSSGTEIKSKEENLPPPSGTNGIFTFTFTPETSLKPSTNYYVYINPNIVDKSGNIVYTKFFNFTTASDLDEKDNPHGHYALNTNMCAACHSSHVGSNDSLEGGYYQVTFDDKLKEDQSQNYCMACHDGTLNAPAIDKINSKYQHNNPADYSQAGTDTLNQTDSCTSCHNPHMSWSKENPNMLKDHYVYTHKDADKDKGVNPLKVDSLEVSCNNCHEDNTIYDQSKNPGQYEVLSYNKSSTSVGQLSDYSLCLRCHNLEKNKLDPKTVDIATYYSDTKSGHNFVLAANQSTQADGSTLNGQIPCAECHDTHGSNNIMNLREQLGNVKLSDADKFKTTGTSWTASNERQFCLKCHNNSTEIYGKTGTFNSTNAAGNLITGHQIGDTQPCSSCHGTGSTAVEKALSAAHAPQSVSTSSSSSSSSSSSGLSPSTTPH